MPFAALFTSLALAASMSQVQDGLPQPGSQTPWKPGSAAGAGAPVVVRMDAGETGLAVHYHFSEPVTRLRLAAPLSETLDRVRLDGAAGRLAGGIAHCGPDCVFEEAELVRYAPPARAYPDVIDAGECGLWADVSAFAPADPDTGVALPFLIRFGDSEIRPTGETPQYVAVRTPVRTPVCADVTLMAEDRLAVSAARMADDYGAIFGHLPPDAPWLIVADGSLVRPGARAVSGAAASDELIFLFADPDETPDVDAAFGVLSHEIAHLWIGRRARLHPQFEQAWIMEGAAEYLSLKQLLRINAVGEAHVLGQVSRHLSACLSALNESRLLLNDSTQDGAFPYNCGTLIALFADQAMRRAGSSFEAAMADMVADPAFRSATATAIDYLGVLSAHMGARAEQALSDVLLSPAPDKRARVLTLLAAAGLGEESGAGHPPPAAFLTSVAARHVVGELCPEGGGRFWIDGGVIVELSRGCDGPAGTSELSLIGDADPLSDPQAALEALEAGCAGGDPVQISLGAGPRLLSCTRPAPDYFRGFALNEARALDILTGGP